MKCAKSDESDESDLRNSVPCFQPCNTTFKQMIGQDSWQRKVQTYNDSGLFLLTSAAIESASHLYIFLLIINIFSDRVLIVKNKMVVSKKIILLILGDHKKKSIFLLRILAAIIYISSCLHAGCLSLSSSSEEKSMGAKIIFFVVARFSSSSRSISFLARLKGIRSLQVAPSECSMYYSSSFK